MVKNLLLMLVMGIFCMGANAQVEIPYNPVKLQVSKGEKGYIIRGEIANAKDGMKVYLLNDQVWPEVLLDSTELKGGKFVFTGYVEYPLILKITLNSNKEDSYGLLGTAFYLENSEISFTADVNTWETYYYNPDVKGKVPAVVKGSKENDLYLKMKSEEEAIKAQKAPLDEKFMNTATATNAKQMVPLVKQLKVFEQALVDLRLKYIHQYPGTSMAIDLLGWEIKSTVYINYTIPQLEELENLMVKANPRRADELKEWFAQAKRTALGVKYTDIELKTVDGKVVKLSDYIPEGKYVLLDFWMSGCGPCRGELPHVKQVYEENKDKLVIVSIAAEPEMSEWLKAVNEENMPWTQLYDWRNWDDKEGVNGKFNVIAFPTCILLDKEGRFFKTDARGANLEIILDELFGYWNKK